MAWAVIDYALHDQAPKEFGGFGLGVLLVEGVTQGDWFAATDVRENGTQYRGSLAAIRHPVGVRGGIESQSRVLALNAFALCTRLDPGAFCGEALQDEGVHGPLEPELRLVDFSHP